MTLAEWLNLSMDVRNPQVAPPPPHLDAPYPGVQAPPRIEAPVTGPQAPPHLDAPYPAPDPRDVMFDNGLTLTEFLGLPIDASLDPDRPDQIVGQDEWGRTVYQGMTGQQYTIRTGPSGPSVPEMRDAALSAVREDPLQFGGDVVRAVADGAWNGVAAPGNALRGQPMTYGDVADTALDWGILGAAGTAPQGALRAGTLRRAQMNPGAGIDDYVGGHRAPYRDGYSAPLNDLAGNIYPDDIYSDMAWRYYGQGDTALDREGARLLQRYRGDPNAEVPIYRAAPTDVTDINAGDWVSLSERYAEMHGDSWIGDDFNLLEGRARAGDLFTDGNSMHEFGWSPAPETPAQEVARLLREGRAGEVTEEMYAAADPQELTRLNAFAGRNSPDEAMTLWHGSPYDFRQFDMSFIGRGEGQQDLGRGFSFSDDMGAANMYRNPAQRWGDVAAAERYAELGPGRLYEVAIDATPTQFLDFYGPWQSQIPAGSPLRAEIENVIRQQPGDMQELFTDPQTRLSSVWRDGMEGAATSSDFAGNFRRNFRGDVEYTVFDPARLEIQRVLDAALNEIPLAETPAQQIARLLREGRAGEVTDEMYAAADPQELTRLYANSGTGMDLPMDEASRMARAGDLEFDTDAYHATRAPGDFAAFRPGARGSTYLAATPEGAVRGAAGQALENPQAAPGAQSVTGVLPLRVRSADVDGLGVNAEAWNALPEMVDGDEALRALQPEIESLGAQYWDDVYLSLPHGDGYRYYRNDPPAVSYAEIGPGRNVFGYRAPAWNSGSDVPSLNRMEARGRSGFLVADEAGSSIVAGPNMPIRSRFARFDPRLSHLANLSAAGAGMGIALPYLADEEQGNALAAFSEPY